MSIYNDILCMCYGSKFVILKSHYDKENQQKCYATNRRVYLNDENLIVSSCISFQVSGGSNYVDWTCIAIGLSNGRINFYSENGILIYERDIHNESILNLRMIGEEFLVFYPSCIVVYQTAHLISLLKTLKEMLNKAKTTKIDLMDKDYMLVFKKWDYKGKEKELLISDALMVPQYKTSLFDHILAESLELGFTKKYRLTPYQSSNIISCGTNPFLNFHSAREGFKQQGVLQDVAKAMVSKITSWLTLGNQSNATSPDDLQDVSEILYPRHELVDYQRTGCNIFVSPSNYQLAAVTDTLGRIFLLDINKGIPIRMWKGYREAQCGFIDVTESRQQRKEINEGRRSGLFLIIYAPRKAIIEIWCLQKGPKVATFQCSKNGFLIYNNHQNDSQQQHHHGHKHKHAKMLSCLFFDSNDNSLKSFFIPFHCILSEANSKSAEDFHYFKRLKMALRCIDLKDEISVQNGIIEPCQQIQTPEIKLKCLELITNYKKVEPTILISVIDIFKSKDEIMEELNICNEKIQDQIYRDQLSASCDNYLALINCFILATGIHSEECVKNQTIELKENDYVTMQRIIELMSLNKKSQASSSGKTVSFKDAKDVENSIVTFLSCFVVTNKGEISLNTEHIQNAFDTIGSVFFSNIWKEKLPASILQEILQLSRLKSEEVIKCFMHFFFHQEINFDSEDQVLADMTKFKIILSEFFLI
jgi:Rab3 GTPase-activating protein non-catalytic subunit